MARAPACCRFGQKTPKHQHFGISAWVWMAAPAMSELRRGTDTNSSVTTFSRMTLYGADIQRINTLRWRRQPPVWPFFRRGSARRLRDGKPSACLYFTKRMGMCARTILRPLHGAAGLPSIVNNMVSILWDALLSFAHNALALFSNMSSALRQRILSSYSAPRSMLFNMDKTLHFLCALSSDIAGSLLWRASNGRRCRQASA